FTALSAHWGGSTISYRYDWLTLLRVAKQYLDTSAPIPVSTEFSNWVANRSTNATACGTTIDKTFPTLTVTAPNVDGGVTNVCPTFSLTISATDNVSVSITQW